jgi:hypothetical protein
MVPLQRWINVPALGVRAWLFLLLMMPFHLSAQEPEELYIALSPSTVTIRTENSQGSGFFVAPGIIATNHHVIAGSRRAYCFPSNSDRRYEIEGVVAVDRDRDLALLKVKGLDRPAIPISNDPVRIGQRVYVIGTPHGLPATFSDGIVSALREHSGYGLIQISAPISPGSSGGPVLNARGQLIGVAVSQSRQGQNLNFAVPAVELKGLLELRDPRPGREEEPPPSLATGRPLAGRSELRATVEEWGNCRIMAFSEKRGAVAIRGNNTSAYTRDIPAGLRELLRELSGSDQRIDDVVIRDDGSWLVVHGGSVTARGMPRDLIERLQERAAQGSSFRSITVNNNGAWIVVSGTGYMASDTRLIEYLQEGSQRLGSPYSAHLTDRGMVICYERGYTWLGRVPPDLKEKVTRSNVDTFRVAFLESGAWFFADDTGTFAVRM